MDGIPVSSYDHFQPDNLLRQLPMDFFPDRQSPLKVSRTHTERPTGGRDWEDGDFSRFLCFDGWGLVSLWYMLIPKNHWTNPPKRGVLTLFFAGFLLGSPNQQVWDPMILRGMIYIYIYNWAVLSDEQSWAIAKCRNTGGGGSHQPDKKIDFAIGFLWKHSSFHGNLQPSFLRVISYMLQLPYFWGFKRSCFMSFGVQRFNDKMIRIYDSHESKW